jgi:hypothetical protein
MTVNSLETRLRNALTGSKVPVVGQADPDYEDFIKRWSNAAVKQAV